MRAKTKFVCQECGYETPRWLGRCPDCSRWNSLVEEVELKKGLGDRLLAEKVEVKPISDVPMDEEGRLSTGMVELDRILGGGVVPGSVVLIGGDPGIGKSTLLLQASQKLSLKYGSVLYVSGEESAKQVKMRAERLKVSSPNLYILPEINLERIREDVEKLSPRVVVIDSIQAIYRSDLSSAPGTISQVRESASSLIYLSKRKGIATFLIGHVTKEGSIAGPRVLEHMVDTVLYFEGEVHQNFRILRAVKNRFGSTNEIGIFEMVEEGLQEVENPSQILLSERAKEVSGSMVVPCLEGTRPLLIELQALVSPTSFAAPRRTVSGVDYNRSCLLFAVLEKRAGLHLQNQDIFINVAGGIKLAEPAVDLGLTIAVASSFKDEKTLPEMVALGEVGLGGEVRPVSRVELRIKEASKLGFKQCLLPQSNLKGLKRTDTIQLIGVGSIRDALEQALIKRR